MAQELYIGWNLGRRSQEKGNVYCKKLLLSSRQYGFIQLMRGELGNGIRELLEGRFGMIFKIVIFFHSNSCGTGTAHSWVNCIRTTSVILKLFKFEHREVLWEMGKNGRLWGMEWKWNQMNN